MIVTKEWVMSNRTGAGAWTRAQIEALGIKWPPTKGWVGLIAGTEITEVQRQKFELSKNITSNRAANRKAKANNMQLDLNDKAQKAYRNGMESAKLGLSEKDNPYLKYPGVSGPALSGWWSAGFIAAKSL